MTTAHEMLTEIIDLGARANAHSHVAFVALSHYVNAAEWILGNVDAGDYDAREIANHLACAKENAAIYGC